MDAAPVTVPADVVGCEASVADDATVAGAAGLPVLRLPRLVGDHEAALQDLGGRSVLVDLWANWCAPCREEMPLLQEAYESHGDRIGFLGSTPRTRARLRSRCSPTWGVTYAHVVDEHRALMTGLAVPGLPVTLAVAADGRVVDRQVGPVSTARLGELVSRLTAEVASP